MQTSRSLRWLTSHFIPLFYNK